MHAISQPRIVSCPCYLYVPGMCHDTLQVTMQSYVDRTLTLDMVELEKKDKVGRLVSAVQCIR